MPPRAVSVGVAALAAVFAGSVLPPPWALAWGLVVAAAALIACWRVVGGGRGGAVAGWLVGAAVVAPSVIPGVQRLVWARFLRPADAPSLAAPELVEVLTTSLTWLGAASLGVTVALPLLCAGLLGLAPAAREPAPPTRLSRLVPLLAVPPLALTTVAVSTSLGRLGESIAQAEAGGVAGELPGGSSSAPLAVLVLFMLFQGVALLGAVVASVRALRAPTGRVSAWASIGGYGLLLAGTMGPSLAFGVGAAFGPVAALPAWQAGGAVGMDLLDPLHGAIVRAYAGVTASSMLIVTLTLGLVATIRKLAGAGGAG